MDADFPAAHSMDTDWFAVDRCGHVAYFNSGPEGAVPEGAPSLFGIVGHRQPLADELNRCLQRGQIRPGVHASRVTVMPIGPPDKKASLSQAFLLLGPGLKSNPSWLRKAEAGDCSWITEPTLGTTDGRDWMAGWIGEETWTWLHAAAHRCLGCVDGLVIDFDLRLDRLGLIRYDCSGYDSEPYEKASEPPRPTTLDELSSTIGRSLPEAPRFSSFCFRQKRLIQPVQWLPSRTYDQLGWIDEEGRKRNVDGTYAEKSEEDGDES